MTLNIKAEPRTIRSCGDCKWSDNVGQNDYPYGVHPKQPKRWLGKSERNSRCREARTGLTPFDCGPKAHYFEAYK